MILFYIILCVPIILFLKLLRTKHKNKPLMALCVITYDAPLWGIIRQYGSKGNDFRVAESKF